MTTQTQAPPKPAAVADGLATAAERYIHSIDALGSTPAGAPTYAEADAAVLDAIIALDRIAAPAAQAARIEQAQRRDADRALPTPPAWFVQDTIGICANCVDTADVGDRLQVQPLDDRDRCPSCAEQWHSPEDNDSPAADAGAFSPVAPAAQPIGPALFYALHRAILAEQAARERRTDRNDWPILAAAERCDAERALIAADAAPFECDAAAVYAVAVEASSPGPRIVWTGEMDGFRIEWGTDPEAAEPQQNESE